MNSSVLPHQEADMLEPKEINALRFVGGKTAKVGAHNYVPGRLQLLVKLLLDEARHAFVILEFSAVVLFVGLATEVNYNFLGFLRHVAETISRHDLVKIFLFRLADFVHGRPFLIHVSFLFFYILTTLTFKL